jgi:shikimate dehydrogenase
MKIDIHTKMITLLGTPLGQSFAARMQNRGYEAAGLNLCYFYTEVDNEHLGEVVQGLRHMNFAGFAVTKPNKVKVLEYLDELDPLCEKMGSCNTVIRHADGRLTGYNTDGDGFYTALTGEAGIDVRKHTFFLIGSGGAGRAIASVLAYHGAPKIYVTDVCEASGRQLVSDLNGRFGADAEFVPAGSYEKAGSCSAILNASGIGMGKTIGQSPVPKAMFQPGQFCFDACYNPAKTQFLLDAEAAGCRIMNGLGMSLYQGARQIELWTGKKAPVEAMRQELLTIIAESESSAT